MRLIVMGQQAFGKDALEKILEAGHRRGRRGLLRAGQGRQARRSDQGVCARKGSAGLSAAHFKDQATLDELARSMPI